METWIGKDIQQASKTLEQGGLVAIPTETVYGLAANALNPEAVLRIYETKGRPTFNPLIVHISSLMEMEKYAESVHPVLFQLAERFSPGPITFVVKKKSIVPDIVTGGGETVALRIPDHPLTLSLLKQLDFPLAAPSANPFGYISPVTAQHVYEQLSGKIDGILDGGACQVGIESTVVTMIDNDLVVLRTGGITVEDIRSLYPNVKTMLHSSSNPQSPGQLKSHYAPGCPLLIGNIAELIQQFNDKKLGVLSFQDEFSSSNIIHQEVLSSDGVLKEAASALFSAMRRLDAAKVDLILTEKFPDEGLGLAINDRLQRAASTN